MLHPKVCGAIRKELGSRYRNLPVSIVEYGNVPKITGEAGGYFTKGGTPIRYPSAYSKTGWSNMQYICSTVSLDVPLSWLRKFCKNNYYSVVIPGAEFFVTGKRAIRNVERVMARAERDLLKAPEKKDILINAAYNTVTNYIAFAEGYFYFTHLKDSYKILGYRSKEISKKCGFELSKEDANRWLNYSENLSPRNWFFKIYFPVGDVSYLYRRGLNFSEPEVCYWAAEVIQDPCRKNSLEKKREFTGPHGEKLSYTYLSKLDEVEPEDLNNGLKSSVNKVFENAAERAAKGKLEYMRQQTKALIKDPDWWPGDTENWKLLRSGADLLKEGEELAHCVATYAGYVKRKESIIVSLKADDGQRSTLEIDPKTLMPGQHYGYVNSKPAESCLALSHKLLSIINNYSKKKKGSINALR